MSDEEAQPVCVIDHDPERKGKTQPPATHGYLCKRHSETLYSDIKGIPDLYAELTVEMTVRHDSGGNMHTKISGSPALIRLDALSLMDPRSRIGVEMGTNPEGDLVLEEARYRHYEPYADVPSVVGSWALALAEEHHLGSPIDTLWRSVNLLLAWWSTVVASPWIDEMYSELHTLHRILWRLTDQPEPVGRCFGWDPTRPCGAPVYQAEDGNLQCSRDKCGRKYSGLDALRMQIQAEREGV